MGTWIAFGISTRLYIWCWPSSPQKAPFNFLAWYIYTFDTFCQPDQLLDSSMFPNPEPNHGRQHRALPAPTWHVGKDCEGKANWKLPRTVLCQSYSQHLSTATYWLFVSWGHEWNPRTVFQEWVRPWRSSRLGPGTDSSWSSWHLDSYSVFILGIDSPCSLLWKEQFASYIQHVLPYSHASHARPRERHLGTSSLSLPFSSAKGLPEGGLCIFQMFPAKARQPCLESQRRARKFSQLGVPLSKFGSIGALQPVLCTNPSLLLCRHLFKRRCVSVFKSLPFCFETGSYPRHLTNLELTM